MAEGAGQIEFERELNVLVGSFFWWLDTAGLQPEESITLLCYLSALFHKGEIISFFLREYSPLLLC